MTRGAGAPARDATPPGLAITPRRGAVAAQLDAALEVRPGGLWVRTLVRVGAGGEAALRRHGAEIGARAGDIVTARLPLAAVPAVLADPGIHRMEAAAALSHTGRVQPAPVGASLTSARNDSAAADAGFDGLRRLVGDRWEGLAGQGVIVGVYDSGLDLDHGDFLRPDGSTRVLYAWDQTVDGPEPISAGASAFDYGTECTAAVIDGGTCPMADIIGHGTHVTGVAAGDGSATGNGLEPYRFPGGAPGADLIVVKGGDGTFTAAGLVDGVAYIFERAAELGRPAVVNVSLSSSQGPHDGTTLLEQALDALSGPGRIIVSGSGNVGDHRNAFPFAINGPNHAMGAAGGAGHNVIIPPYSPTPGGENDILAAELWYDGADSLTITIRPPRGGAPVTVTTGDSALVETSQGAIGILNAVGGPDPGNGDHVVLIALAEYGSAPAPDTGRWSIEVAPEAIHADGVYHLWITIHSLAYEGFPPRLEGGTTNAYLVGVPASADRVLAAGGHVTRHGWIGLGGEPQLAEVREDLGDIAYFSSPGPRRDGVQKPDVTAPAKFLISSLSSKATLFDGNEFLIEQDSVHVALLGTSMASPQLAAAVAILLQIQPDLTPEQARDLIRLSAATDAFVPAALPHPTWGAGKLDAGAAARRLRPTGLAGPEDDVNLSANPVRGDALVISYAGTPRSVAIYTIVAERVRGFSAAEVGPLSTVWPLDNDAGAAVANGLYVLVVQYDDHRVLRKILVARP